MGDDSGASSKGGIPAWQRTQSDQRDTSEPERPIQASRSKEDELQPRNAKDVDSKDGNDEALIQKAKRFLENEEVKGESADKKAAFLETKGFSKDILQKTMSAAEPLAEPDVHSTTPQQRQSATPQPSQDRDVAPIITYPEFLMHANKPPPLVTARRLLNIAYIASGTAAAVYGLSKYLVGPMTESLQASRHDFAVNAKEKIEELNKKLGHAISVDPDQVIGENAAGASRSKDADSTSNADTDDSDPTELFHRDFGTQTSAMPSPKPKSATSSSSGELLTVERNPDDIQAFKLLHLSSLCKDLNTETDSEGDTSQEVSTVIKVLHEHLDSLSLPATAFTVNAAYDAYGMPRDGKKDEDEISKMKSEIRSVKGVLLNARNFPGGRRANFPPSASVG
ncbi:MAG: hypothetical protein M1828_007202 [Chrysothrix sp. TS-e1954]|nr:MAG: hypothetical protein M1828_007202 [Chrysothrix sp. TS-e1954]